MNRRTKRKLRRLIWTAWEYLKLAAVVMFAMAAGAACYHQHLVQHRLQVEQRWEPEIRVETLQDASEGKHGSSGTDRIHHDTG